MCLIYWAVEPGSCVDPILDILINGTNNLPIAMVSFPSEMLFWQRDNPLCTYDEISNNRSYYINLAKDILNNVFPVNTQNQIILNEWHALQK